ncbi:hypothetical protein ES703_86898 [subsurface metagenome]
MEYIAYCVKCKKKVVVTFPKVEDVTGKTGTRKAVKGLCGACGTKLCVFIK